MEEEEPSVDDEWRLIEQGYVETCEKVLDKRNQTKRSGSVRRPGRQLSNERRRKMRGTWPGREIRGAMRVGGIRS